MMRQRWTSLALGLAIALPAAVMGETARLVPTTVPTTVLFAPQMQAALDRTYGESEAPVLQKTISERVALALGGTGCAGVAEVEVTLLDARPTHPTDRQIGDNPALDRLRTHFVGGATFSVRLLDGSGRELKTLRYDWYAQDLRHGSRGAEPWGDVRLASEGLGSELARTCRTLARPHPAAS
jgi:hypothetical protein